MNYEKHHFGENKSISIYHPTDLTFPLHNHRSFELILVEEGEFEIIVDKNPYTVKKNHSFFLFPHQYHEIITNDHSILLVFIFSPELVEDFYQQTNGFHWQQPLQKLTPELVKQNIKILLNNSSVYKRKSLLYNLIDYYSLQSPLIPAAPTFESTTDDVLAYLETNYTKQITLKELAQKLDYSYNYLSALINNELGYTFNELLNTYRVNHAIELIEESDLSLTDIAYQAGFQNSRSFNRNFKLLQAMTPSEYRQQLR